MLHVKGPSIHFASTPLPAAQAAEPIDWRWLLNSVLRRRLSIAVLVLLGMAGASAYVATRAGSFTAQTHLHLTNLKLTFSRDDALFAETQLDPTFLETQIQLMRSEKVAFSVVDALQLTEAEGDKAVQSLKQRLQALLAEYLPHDLAPSQAPEAADDGSPRREAMRQLQRGLSVERAGMSNIVTLRYTAPDPVQAARIANAFARAYIDDQTAARIESAQSASIWLRERLRDVGPKTRIVAQALPPTETSNPRGLLLVALAGLIAAGLGVSLALLRQLFDRKVRTPEQVVAASGAACLGFLPHLKVRRRLRLWRSKPPAEGTVPVIPRHCWASRNLNSSAAAALDHARVAIDGALGRSEARWIGVTGTFPGEGTSTVAANLAHLMAARGERVLLVDCNGADPSLSRILAPKAKLGLTDDLRADEGSVRDVLIEAVLTDPTDGMGFLPLGSACADGRHPPLWSGEMSRCLQAASASYDTIVCDLPALSAAAEVRAASRFLSGFILVVGWGSPSEEHLRIGVDGAGAFRDRLLGAVFNRVGVADLGRTGSPTATFLKQGAPARLHAGAVR
ncbi:cellulose synthase operon protein YhjQ/BcsQ [Methylorubrum salsuginis]|uniref:Chain length determinant protein n=1 Tax=Methylorubrum salsuginis TaxID=414703 RepID=A0A1I4LP83_9HYPH|nr:cellulose synthase operon protein YhjQ/BcsQ [Methylorubrum salsuginis]SFL92918.1 Chain length determinant protein [Methylorubrum salsuginis]